MELPVLFFTAFFCSTLCWGAGTWPVAATEFSSGDYVQISSDEDLVTELHSHGIGFNGDMKPTLGKIGKVKYIDSDGDLKVIICDTTWFYSAKAVTKLASAGDSGPEISSNCERSQSIVNVKQRRLGDDLNLECILNDAIPSSDVRWVKDGESIRKGSSSRITISEDDPETYTLQIEDFKPEDAGWYTCEVTKHGDLIDTAAVKVEVDQEDTKIVTGDLVQITMDEDLIRELHSHGIGYVGGMEKTLGKIGKVNYIDSDGDLKVSICDTTWFYSTKVVTKLASAGESGPEVSSDCERSQTTLHIKQRRIGNDLKLECTLDDIIPPASVQWVKDGVHIDGDSVSKGSSPRITVSHDDPETFTLQIENVNREDAGWYTCEVRHHDEVIGTGAVEVKVDQADTKIVKGDVVQITLDEDLIRELHSHGIGYVGSMEKTLGKIGLVNFIDDDGDLNVEICGTDWYYSAKGVTKLASTGAGAPPVSTDCTRSAAIVTVSQERIGRSVKLECSVVRKPVETSLSWKKDLEPLKHASLTVRTDDSYTEEILDLKPEDVGWYTCELRDDDTDELAAVSALEVNKIEQIEKFQDGDLVQITFDEDLIKKLHSHGIGFPGGMEPTLGKIGRVRYVDSDGDLNVAICDDTWFYSAKAVTKLSSAGPYTPLVSSDCTKSESTVTIREDKVRSDVKLACAVDPKPKDSYVRWVKGTRDVCINDKVDDLFPRITSFSSFFTFSSDAVGIQIHNVEPEDAGWYTCEVRTDGELYATRAVELKVEKGDSTEPTTKLDDGTFSEGDVVQVLSDKDTVAALEDAHGGWTGGMEPALGKIGKILESRANGNIQVRVCGDTWVYNPKAVVKIESGSSDTRPSISKDCVHTDATIVAKQERSGTTVTVECTVNNKPEGYLNLKWFKEAVEFEPDHIRIKTEDSSYTETFRIESTEPEYAGWYTCEARNHEGLAATGAVKVLDATEETSSPRPETETARAAGGEFEVGDWVQVLSDEDRVREIHEVRVGFVDDMRKTLGKIGKVLSIDSDKDLYVEICGDTWYYKPNAVIKLASAGSSKFKIPAECVYSNATIDFRQTKIGDSVNLKCTMTDKDSSSGVRLLKGDRVIFSEHSYRRPEFDVTKRIEGSSRVFTLKIHDVKPDDLTWYTCDLIDDDENVVAIGVVKVEETSSPHPVTETRVAGGEFEVGDVVQVLSDEARVRELHEGRVGFVDSMHQTLGKIGKVLRIDSDKDLYVEICGDTWYYHPKAVIKLSSAGSSTPKKSLNCASSDATVSIVQMRVGNDVILDCTVNNKPYQSHVYWVNKDGQISEDSVSVWKPRVRVNSESTRTFRLQIRDLRSEDEGWYACELKKEDELAATAVVKVEVGEARVLPDESIEIQTFHLDTETKPDAVDEEFHEGDVVQVLFNEATVRKRFGSLNFPDEMRQTLGKIGKVLRQDSVKDVYTSICGTQWWYKPNTLIKLAPAGSSAPVIPTHCTQSNTTVSISEERSGNNVRFTCTVENPPVDSHVLWEKDGRRMFRDSVKEIEDPRITLPVQLSARKSVIKIEDVKPEDAGWYTCGISKFSHVAAIAAAKLEVRHLPTAISTTTEATVTDDKFEEGDLVWVLSDKEKVKELEEDHGGWNDEMEKSLGKIGRISSVYHDGDLSVEVCKTSWLYNPKAVIKIASAGDSAPEISSECVTSNATTKITQERVGNVVKLICTVVNEPTTYSYVNWAKEGVQISRDGSLKIRNPRIKILSDYSPITQTMEIANMKPEDAGWYTCEVRNSDNKLAAVRAVQLSYLPHEEPATSCVDCAALSSIDEELVDIKHLIANSTSELRSKLNDISERLEMVEHRFLAPIGDEQATS